MFTAYWFRLISWSASLSVMGLINTVGSVLFGKLKGWLIFYRVASQLHLAG